MNGEKDGTRAVILLVHGSRQPGAAKDLDGLLEGLRSRLPGRKVALAFLSLGEPAWVSVCAGLLRDGIREMVILPFFIHAGKHLIEDIPRLAQELSQAHPELRVILAKNLGAGASLAGLAAERVREAQEA
jgi:sirohydrochlorin cobaltochelatase